MHQRLEQPGLVLEMIIQGGLGQPGVVHDVLHRGRRVAVVGKKLSAARSSCSRVSEEVAGLAINQLTER